MLPQHVFPHLGQAAQTDQAALDAAIDSTWNAIVRNVRRTLHWPRFRLLLLAQRSGDEHGGLERLSADLIATIGHHMINGTKDAHGFEVAGSFDMPFEERPEYDENKLEAYGIVTAARQAVRDAQLAQVRAMSAALHGTTAVSDGLSVFERMGL